jgi:hypothetical protein
LVSLLKPLNLNGLIIELRSAGSYKVGDIHWAKSLDIVLLCCC